MIPLVIAALAFPALGDVVHTRDGKKVEGRVFESEFFVDVEVDPPPGKPPVKPVRVLRKDILKIELAPDFIHCPETVPFPFDQLEKADYTYFPCGRLILCLPQPPASKVIAIDLRAVKKAWEVEVPNRVSEPVISGRTVYFMQREKEADDSKKIKINGVAASKEIHRLTVTAVEIETGQVLWKQAFDNLDRKDQHWEYVPIFPPALYVLPDRLALRTLKLGYPMDSAFNVDKSRSIRYVSFVAFDPVEKKILSRTDSADGAEMGYPYFAEDIIVTQLYQGAARWRLSGIAMKDGKLRWQSEPFTAGKLFEVTEEYAYVTDGNTITTFSTKNGRKNDLWKVDCSGGTIAGVDLNYIYLYRNRKPPRAIVGIDPKKGAEAWKIEMGDNDELFHLLFAGHRLIYTDKQNTIACFDTLAKKEIWRWTGPGPGFPAYARVMGSTLSFYKDGRVTQLDLDTGRRIWEVRFSYQTALQAGDAGLMCKHLKGTDVIHERKLPKAAEFFTATGTPLRNAIGEESWSAPATDKGTLYTLSGSGYLAAVDLKEKKPLWTQKVAAQAVQALSPPLLTGKGVAVNVAGELVAYEPDGKTKMWSTKNQVFRPDRPCEMTPQGLLTFSNAGAVAVNPATGEKVWETPLRSVNGYAVADGKIYALTHQNLQVLDLKSGAPGDTCALPRNATLVAAEGKKVFVATGPFGLVEAQGDEARTVFKPKEQNVRVTTKGFRGSLVAADGAAIYSHADGEVARFEGGSEKATWTFATPGYTSALLVHGGRVWFGAWGAGLYGLNVKTGAVEWKVDGLSDVPLFTPIVRDGKVAFWSSDGWVVATD